MTRIWAMLGGIAALVFLIDQGIKVYFATHFAVGQSISIIPRIFHLTYVQNTGAAFGILKGARFFLIGVSAFVLYLIGVYIFYRRPRSAWTLTSLGFIMGGSISNLLDRLVRGYVIDYFDFRVWPVFNVADTMINVGVAMLVLYFIFHRERTV